MTDTPAPLGAASPLSAAWAQRFGDRARRGGLKPVSAADLASQLSARLCHDFVSPASAIVSGLDLLEDPSAADMRDDAMNLIAASAKKLVSAAGLLAGGVRLLHASAESFDTRELERLTQRRLRPRAARVWPGGSIRRCCPRRPARALLNLAQIGATALPTGGDRDDPEPSVAGRRRAAGGGGGRRAGATAAGGGQRPSGARSWTDGLGGHWVQAYFLHQLLKSVGGKPGPFAMARGPGRAARPRHSGHEPVSYRLIRVNLPVAAPLLNPRRPRVRSKRAPCRVPRTVGVTDMDPASSFPALPARSEPPEDVPGGR